MNVPLVEVTGLKTLMLNRKKEQTNTIDSRGKNLNGVDTVTRAFQSSTDITQNPNFKEIKRLIIRAEEKIATLVRAHAKGTLDQVDNESKSVSEDDSEEKDNTIEVNLSNKSKKDPMSLNQESRHYAEDAIVDYNKVSIQRI